MKILHIINDLSMGGGQNLLIGLAGIQQKRGNKVTVLALQKSGDSIVAERIREKGCNVEILTERVSLHNPLQIFMLLPWLRKYDIVHVHLFPALYWCGFAKMISFCRTPLVYTEHSTKNRRRTHPILRRIDKFVYKYCYNKVIACADKAMETFSQVYPSVKHVCTVNNGVDTLKYNQAIPYSKQQLLEISEDCFLVTMVARFMYMKRQDTIVEAIKHLPEIFHVCFVGSSPNDEGLLKVKKLAEELAVADRVHFLYIRSDVPRILKTSDVVIMSSEYEGLSLSSIEGMAAGKPFIATDVNGLREIVKDAGELFELGNSEQLATILLHLATDTQYYKKISFRCCERAAQYDIRQMVDKYMKIYKEFC